MSEGRFTTINYEYTDGSIGSIKVQPDTLGLQIGSSLNSEVSGARTERRAFISGSRRRQGRNYARLVRIVFTSTPPTGYALNSPITLPLVNTAIYDAASEEGAVGTYLGSQVRVIGVTPKKN